MNQCSHCGNRHSKTEAECRAWTEQLHALLRRPQIDPGHPHHAQARACVLAAIDRLNQGGATLTGEGARLAAPDLVIPLATRYAALILELLDNEKVAIGRAELHAAVGHLAVQAFVGRLSAEAIHPDDRP